MAIISGTGVFSGIDSAKIIEQLVAVERKPVESLKSKKNNINIQISKWGNISNIVNNLKNSLINLKKTNLLPLVANSSDSSVLKASANSNAETGTYFVKINNIASAQSIYSQIFSSTDEEIADLSVFDVQKLKISVGSQYSVITINSANNSLSSLKDAINSTNLNVRANIINDGTGYRLIISSKDTGTANRITIKVDENNDGFFENSLDETDSLGLSRFSFNPSYDQDGNVNGGISNMIQAKKGIDAHIEIDGVGVTRSKNEISDVIPGTTLTLLTSSNEKEISLNISKDYSTASKNINNFVNNYNVIMNALNENSIKNDSITRQMKGNIRDVLIKSYSDKTITNFGINHDKNGVLNFDSLKFENLLKENPSTIIDTINDMAFAMEEILKNYLGKIISDRKDLLNKNVGSIDKRIENLEAKLEKLELTYRKKFYELEKTIGALQKSGDNLTQTLSKWGSSK